MDSNVVTPTAGDSKATIGHSTAAKPWREWLLLVLLQALVTFLVFRPFIEGTRHFAYVDIGSDTYFQFSAFAMHLARMFGEQGWSGWSFGIGLGAPVPFMFGDALRLLTQLRGPEHVLELRIWVYLLKIALGGGFFFLAVRPMVRQGEAALIASLAYSFCGYIVVNGQWDGEANPFVFFPLIVWSIGRLQRKADVVSFPTAVGTTLLSGFFVGTLVVSLGVAFLTALALSDAPRQTLRLWVTRLLPLTGLGLALGAASALPMTLELLDSPRVSGPDSLLGRLGAAGIGLNSLPVLLDEIGGLFHKDLFNVGDVHSAYMNYLESPGFYVGLLPLLLLPQLWNGARADRRLLVVGLAGIALYFLLPVFRLAAFGFASPYFRSTCLWVSLGLLFMGARGLDLVLQRGAGRGALATGVGASAVLLAIVCFAPATQVWLPHVWKVTAFLVVWSALLALGSLAHLRPQRLVTPITVLMVAELVAFAWPSYFAGRYTTGPTAQPYRDVTLPALAAIRGADPSPFYRVEKMYGSAAQDDALAQGYHGVKSYYYHGQAVVAVHRNLDMMPAFVSRPVNYTNWLTGPAERYAMHSVLGVKYVIAKEPLVWPGFERQASGSGWIVYRNELALPLGVVHTRQVTPTQLEELAKVGTEPHRVYRDLALVNAVVVDRALPEWGEVFDVVGAARRGVVDNVKLYAEPAKALQRTGLKIAEFREDRITGTIEPAERGILVFSIPAYAGWSLRVDGQPTATMVANFGMLAAPVVAGKHSVELTYTLPGLRGGLLLSAAAILGLVLLARRRDAPSRADVVA